MSTSVPLSTLAKGITVTAAPAKEVRVELAACSECPDGCVKHSLAAPKFIGYALQDGVSPVVRLKTKDLPGLVDFGQDATHHVSLPVPFGEPIAGGEAEMQTAMRALVDLFAHEDASGMARRLFEAFLGKNADVVVFEDGDLNRAIAAHQNFVDFSDFTLSSPQRPSPSGKKRIHQALREVGWDINNVTRMSDLGGLGARKGLAFNRGSKELAGITRGTGDFANGLGVMIDAVQHVFVFAESYDYDSCKKQYEIELKFVLYDVFGLDDKDLEKAGASGTSPFAARRGLTAWWQLQHQLDYAPLLTRAEVTRKFTVPTEGV